MENFITLLGYILTPIAAVVTWLASRKKQRNDFLKDMQASIDLLADENKKLMAEIIAVRGENKNLMIEIIAVKSENKQLKIELEELNRKLENVKTITKKV